MSIIAIQHVNAANGFVGATPTVGTGVTTITFHSRNDSGALSDSPTQIQYAIYVNSVV